MSIHLRTLNPNDREDLTRLINNKKIWNQLRDYIPHPYGLEDADAFISLTQQESPSLTFAIIKEENELCGVIGFKKQEDIYRMSAEIGYWIGEPYWGQGIASLAVKQITDYGFSELKLERIFAGVFDFNKASMKVLEKNGFQLEGISRRAIMKNNKILDEYRYAKIKGE